MEDKKIVDLFWQRNHQAIIEIQNKYGKLCLQLANRITEIFYQELIRRKVSMTEKKQQRILVIFCEALSLKKESCFYKDIGIVRQ